MRLVGEPIEIVGEEIRGPYGELIGYDTERIEGCVFIPEGTQSVVADNAVVSYSEASVLLPMFREVPVDTTVLIREKEHRVTRPSIQHRSMFGTQRGGTQFFVRRISDDDS